MKITAIRTTDAWGWGPSEIRERTTQCDLTKSALLKFVRTLPTAGKWQLFCENRISPIAVGVHEFLLGTSNYFISEWADDIYWDECEDCASEVSRLQDVTESLISERDYIRPELRLFVRAMEDALRINDDRKGRSGWRGGKMSWLFDLLKKQYYEGTRAWLGNDLELLRSRLVNAANYAMMLYDNSRRRRRGTP